MKTQLKALRLEKSVLDSLVPIIKRKKTNFSTIVTEAIENYIEAQHFSEDIEAGYGAWSDKKHPELKNGTDNYVRKMRKGRKI
ncbi:MAG: hypothetical protein CVV21_11320 [Candidatus Goldiibacteriota bacterium HGW-Goldbacteria-1]|jgi:predicted DNA-binding protein|nr:MAG: hypothetical protein CVV21_11320 [Candidatus Goldiibacteriota bacterium HGW-Goldbacteria-1]